MASLPQASLTLLFRSYGAVLMEHKRLRTSTLSAIDWLQSRT
jgi:hypothetical protein